MANGEPVNSQANNKAYNDGYERIFGNKPAEKGHWVQDPQTGEMVSAEDYQPPARALDAPVMVDRFYEGATVHDGERIRDIGSRRKHREFMREKGLTTVDDYTKTWEKAAEARDLRRTQFKMPSKTRREAIARALYQKWKP